MPLTTTEMIMSAKLAQALSSQNFPILDTQLRAGRHIGIEDLDQYEFLMDYHTELEIFYARYNVELLRAPEGFFYLRPRATTFIPRSVLSGLDMILGKLLCYLYMSPERLANEGFFTFQELYDELYTLTDESKLMKLVNQRSIGSDLDRQKLQEKIRASLNRLRRLGMVWFAANDCSRFRIMSSIFRFGADVRSGEDQRQAQLKLIREGEAVFITEEEQV